MQALLFTHTPRGIRIPVASVKGRCPRPLDDGGVGIAFFATYSTYQTGAGFATKILDFFPQSLHLKKNDRSTMYIQFNHSSQAIALLKNAH